VGGKLRLPCARPLLAASIFSQLPQPVRGSSVSVVSEVGYRPASEGLDAPCALRCFRYGWFPQPPSSKRTYICEVPTINYACDIVDPTPPPTTPYCKCSTFCC
jgi:hypothetical protein